MTTRTLRRGPAAPIIVPPTTAHDRWTTIHIRSRPTRRLALTLAAALLVAACTGGDEADVAIPLPDGSAAPGQPSRSPEPPAATPSPPTTPPSGDAGPTQRCDPEQREALVAAVDGQLEAIADREWEEALAYATPSFRSGIDADDFRRIITGDFPIVAAATARDIGSCTAAVSGDRATLVVTVQDTDGMQQPLLYLFEHDGDRWGINGALPATDGAPGSEEPAITA